MPKRRQVFITILPAKTEVLCTSSLVVMVMKLFIGFPRLITGKTLIFVNTIDSCYSLKLFLEQFSIASSVVNSELPQNSR